MVHVRVTLARIVPVAMRVQFRLVNFICGVSGPETLAHGGMRREPLFCLCGTLTVDVELCVELEPCLEEVKPPVRKRIDERKVYDTDELSEVPDESIPRRAHKQCALSTQRRHGSRINAAHCIGIKNVHNAVDNGTEEVRRCLAVEGVERSPVRKVAAAALGGRGSSSSNVGKSVVVMQGRVRRRAGGHTVRR